MVCRTWRDAIHPEPTLWCHLSSHQERWQNQLVLRYNPSAPLSVSSTSKHWLQNNLQGSNPTRWRGFLYKGQLFPALLEALQSAKRLRNLSISADSRSTYNDILQVTIPNPVDLLTLDLQFVTLPWSFLQGVRLEVLSLQGLRQNGPSTSEILSILSNSPNLRRLILQLLDSDDGADVTFDERPSHTAHPDRIHLPELKTVSIRSVPKTLSHAILNRLDAPLCEAMDVLDCNSSHFDPSSKSPLPTTIKPILRAARRVVISYSAPSPAEGRAMGIETKDPEVRIRDIARPAVTESPGLNLFVWLHDEEDWSYVTQSLDLRSLLNSLTLRFTCSSVVPLEGGESSVPVGDSSPSVDCLDFDGAFDPIPVLRYLSSPQPDRNGRNHWPCPRLKTIAISGRVPWPQASTDELEKQCIKFLQRSSKSVDGLAPPEQVERMVVHRGDIQHHLYHMREFRSVKFFSFSTVMV